MENRIAELEKAIFTEKNKDLCPQCHLEMVDATIFGDSQRRMFCSLCGEFYFFDIESQ